MLAEVSKLTLDNLPAEIRGLAQFITWGRKDGQKRPDVRGGFLEDPDQWLTFDAAVQRVRVGAADGVGLILRGHRIYGALDIDAAVRDGEIIPQPRTSSPARSLHRAKPEPQRPAHPGPGRAFAQHPRQDARGALVGRVDARQDGRARGLQPRWMGDADRSGRGGIADRVAEGRTDRRRLRAGLHDEGRRGRVNAGASCESSAYPRGGMFDYLTGFALRLVRAGVLNVDVLTRHITVEFEAVRSAPADDYDGGEDDDRRIAERALASDIAEDMRAEQWLAEAGL